MEPGDILGHLASFGTPPDAASAARVSAGIQRSLQRIANETFPLVAGGGRDLQFIHAPYGRGKTHFLRVLEHRAREHGFVTAYVDCQLGGSPFKSLPDTYRAIARCMIGPGGHEPFVASGVTGVIEGQFADRSLDEQRAVIENIRANNALAPGYRNLVTAYGAEFVADGRDEALGDLKALLTASPTAGVTVGRLYRQYPHLPRPLGKLGRRNADIWLRALLSLPHVLGHAGLVVLFDETESMLNRGSARRKQEHLAHLRTFIDHMAVGTFAGCAVYYAMAEDFIEIAGEHLAALTQRVERLRLPDIPDQPNPRAIWVDLNELTSPEPKDSRFFAELAGRIVDLGREAGLPPDACERAQDRLILVAEQYAGTLHDGNVREFVKAAATSILETR